MPNPAFGKSPNIQNVVFDNLASLFPGQLSEGHAYFSQGIRGFPALTDVYCGRTVVKGADIVSSTTDYVNDRQPYSVQQPLVGSVSADILGIVVRTRGGLTNLLSDPLDSNSLEVAAVDAGQGASIAEVGAGVIIGVAIPIGITVTDGEVVYTAVNPTNDALILVGELTPTAGGNTGLVIVPAAVFRGTFTSTTNNTVARVQLTANFS